jgi:integral membrane protein (TIGR01906 family)
MININKDNKHLILQSFHNGGWGILGLIGAIMILLVISFNQLFTWFHQIFFESGTWRFYTSDTLIRLFPMRFWRDAFIFVGVLCILFGVITILVTRKYINLEKSK